MSRSRGKIPRISFRPVKPLSLSSNQWRTLEAAYGHQISPKARAQITASTNQFLQFAQAENTGSMKDAIQRAKRLCRCGGALIAAINERAVGDMIREYVDDELALSLAQLEEDEGLAASQYVSEISAELSKFVQACDLTVRRLHYASLHNYWPAGGAWQVWIRQLTAALKAHNLPVAVRKDTDKSRTDIASPFLEFLRVFQTYIPREHARGHHSKAALAEAIHKARRGSKPPVVRRRTPGD